MTVVLRSSDLRREWRVGRHIALALAAAPAMFFVGCSDNGLSVAETETAAKARVTQMLGLEPDAALFTNVFVGRPEDGPLEDQVILCGTVEGTRANGERIARRRFIAGTDPAQWVRFDRTDEMTDVPVRMAADWPTACAGEEEVK